VQASDNCGGKVTVTWEGDVSDGKTCPETITRTYKATDECGNTATCTQTITVDDTTPPVLDCPDDILDPVQALPPAATTPEELAAQGGSVSDNCGPVTLTSKDVDDGAPCPAPYHTVTRTYTATDACGNVSTCTQTIRVKNICNELRGIKFYDTKPDGTQDPATEPGLNGWRFRLFQVVNGVEVLISEGFTDTVEGVDGVVEFTGLPDGTYILRESDPVETNWVNTTPKQCTVTVLNGVVDPEVCFFGNVCLGAGGGHTLGFWSNKNGQAILKANDPGWRVLLNACKLVKADGTPYKVPATSFDTAYANFRTWLLNATAVNMSYMLSVQLAAMKLNIAAGFVNPNQYVFCGPGLGFSQIGQVVLDANTFLGLYPLTKAGHPQRALGESIKNCLDRANNNLNFVQPQPCPYTFPPE
jgi:hypothetical protein